MSLMTVWLVKLVLVCTAGREAGAACGPFFLGIVAGHALGVGISFVIDWIWFSGEGHPVRFG